MRQAYQRPQLTDHGSLATMTHKAGLTIYDAGSGQAFTGEDGTGDVPKCWYQSTIIPCDRIP